MVISVLLGQLAICIYIFWSWEKAMATHSSTLAWKIPGTEAPGRLQSMESLGVGHDITNSLSLFTLMHWRRKWQPTPVFLPGESQGRESLVGCRLWGPQSWTQLKRLSSSSILVLASYLVRKKHNYIISKGKVSIKIVSNNQPSCVCVCVCE